MSRISAPRSFDSAPRAVPRDKSVRRFAQDDDFVGGLKKNTPNRLTLVELTSWVEIRETKSPVETTGSYPTQSPWRSCLAPRIQDNVSITSSRPCGTFPWRLSTQDCVLG